MAIPESRQLDFNEIPVIDISQLMNETDTERVISDIDKACCDVGFFYIIGHGFPSNLIEQLAESAAAYFSLDPDEKMTLGLDASMRGFLPLYYHSQITDSFSGISHQEGFWIGTDFSENSEHPLEQPNRWPLRPASLQTSMNAYLLEIEKLASVLGQAFGHALHQSRDFYSKHFSRPTSRLKLNHYPPQDNPQSIDNIGVVPHTDSGGFTILWQDDNGLEILDHADA
ncbi:MAG: 2-oxoglutarate and iron-dependent oxygenase domain-containing protein [Pseudomonadota bacterium]